MRRKIYLKKRDLEDGKREYFEELEKAGFFENEVEAVKTIDSLERVTAEPVYALRSVPHYTSAAMDGIAVRSEVTIGASETSPKILKEGEDFIFVNTGDPVLEPYDAVIMIEKVRVLEDGKAMIFEPVFPMNDLRPIGEDVTAGEMIVTRYHEIEHYDIPLFLAAGVFEVPVLKKLKAVVIPTGDEIVSPESDLSGGKIPETNGSMTVSFLRENGVDAILKDPVKDDPELIKEAISESLKSFDIVFTIAGSSAGSKDYTYGVLEEMGKVVVHGLNIKPGKPVILAIVDGKPVIGLPGFPVSLEVVLQNVVKDLIMRKYKKVEKIPKKLKAISSTRISSSISEDEFIRGVVAKVEGKTVFSPLKRGAANLISLTRHDSILIVEKGRVVVDEGEEIEVDYKGGDLEGKILVVGSHDVLMDVLADLLRKRDYRIRISSSNVGSMGGIIAVSKGYAHMGGTHLLDPQTGEYNIPYIEKITKDYVLVNMSYRIQGLIVQKGNPKGIKGIEDLAREDIRFINRQKASGTRMLLDHLLKEYGIAPSKINGYEIEEISHLGLAIKIKSGMADVGLGIESVARILDLDFIPIAKERYDLIVNKRFFESEVFKMVMEVLKSEEFRKEAEKIGGYDLSESGRVIVS